MKDMIMKIALMFILSLSICKAQTKIYKVSIISDWTYTKDKSEIEEALNKANLFFEKYNIKFVITDYMRSGIIASDSTLDSTLDNFKNRGSDITLGVVGRHYGSKVGVAFFKQLTRLHSCMVVDLNATTKSTEGFIIAHEILHLMGLDHSSDRRNIMYSHTCHNKVTKEQEKVIEKYSY